MPRPGMSPDAGPRRDLPARRATGAGNPARRRRARAEERCARLSLSMQDERVAEGRVTAVLHGAPLGVRGEKLAEGARLALAGMPLVVKPIVEQQHCAVLERWRDAFERDTRRLVQIAVEVRERDLGMFAGDRVRKRLLERTDVEDR